MSLSTSFTLGVSLSMDAFAASIGQGAQSRNAQWHDAIRVGLFFGVAEALFPVLGWALGLWLGAVMASVDHWIAFFLLLFIGAKMIRDGVRQPGATHASKPQGFLRMAVLALGTSIDAAAVGVSLVVLGVPILQTALIIGTTTFVFTVAGYMLGGSVSSRLPRHAETLGGILLILIGCKILLEHTLLHQG